MTNKNSLSRRVFLGQCAATPFIVSQLGTTNFAHADEVATIPAPVPSDSPETGKPYVGWKEGELDLHFIYTGSAESCFHIYPDGTTMLLDAGDNNGNTGKLPDGSRHSGEWVARYLQRVNPAKDHVDYMMCSHFHDDHCGGSHSHAGKTTGRGKDYYLSGLAQVAEFVHFDEVFDRAYPDYNAPVSAMYQYETPNWLSFVEYQERVNGLKRTPFVVGKANQIVLKKNPDKFKGQFQILNVCGNGTVCIDAPKPEDEFNPDIQLQTENLFVKYPKNNTRGNENRFSLGLRLSYGPFRFYTGGDISGLLKDDNGNEISIEERVGQTVGKVHVCKTNHHSYIDAMRPGFVKSVQAKVYVTNVWSKNHTNPVTMPVMTSRELYPGDRIVCPTIYKPDKPERLTDKEWQKDLVKLGGHVVVKAFDGGKQYKVYYLTANDESMTVKAVFGPWKAE